MNRHRVALVVAVAVASVATSAAPASAYTKNHLGGHFTDGSAMTLTLNKARSAVINANIYVKGRCSDGLPFQVRADLLLAPDPAGAHPKPGQRVLAGGKLSSGRFTASAESPMSYSTSEGDATGTLKETVAGKVPRRGLAKGTYTASITLTTPSGATIDCTTDALRWTALSNPRVYSGATSDGAPVVVELNARATKVRVFRMVWEADCTNGDRQYTNVWAEAITNFPLSRRYVWGDDFTDHENHDDGSQADVSYRLGGRLSRHRATGKARISVVSTNADGTAGGTCESGSLSYTAVN